jgi:integrase
MPSPRKPSIYDRFEPHADRTFAEAATKYLAKFQGKPGSKSRAAQSIDTVAGYIGHLRLIDVDDEALAQFKEDRLLGRPPFVHADGRPRPAMANTVNKDLTQVVTVLNKAAGTFRWIPFVPTIEHVKGAVRRAHPLTWEEQDALGRHLPTGWDVGVMAFAINTGCRKEELFGLKWSHRQWVPELDIKNPDGTVKERMYVFVLNETKNGHQRAVICNSIARRAVEAQRKQQAKDGMQTEYVFPSRHHGYLGSRVRQTGKVWEKAWKDAGLPSGKLVKKGMHNCRHTFAHRLRAVEVPKEDRNALLGHANTDIAEHYSVPDLSRLLEHAEKITVRRATTVLRAVG